MTHHNERPIPTAPEADEAIVWIDRGNALVVETDAIHEPAFVALSRELGESEESFLARTVHELGEATHVTVSGPASARLGLEREYVAVTHHPDRLVDVEPKAARATRTRFRYGG